MYERHFGLTMKPFQSVPDPEFFYPSTNHMNALSCLEYAVMERTGFILLTGEIGSGKTTVVQRLVKSLTSSVETAVVSHTNVTAGELLGLIINAFGIHPSGLGKAAELEALHRFLSALYQRDRHGLLIIDEAQNLDREALEEVRMLSNFQRDNRLVLQILLVGQPELRFRLRMPDLTQLHQRIGIAYHLRAFTREETGEYISHRLAMAGGRPGLFTPEAVDRIHRASLGVARTINILCDTALVYGFADDLHVIGPEVIDQVLSDRKEMGIETGEMLTAQREGTPPPELSREDTNITCRLERLEEGMQRLRMELELRFEEMERLSRAMVWDLAGKIKEMYEDERKRYEELALKHARLRSEFLMITGDGPSSEALGSSSPETSSNNKESGYHRQSVSPPPDTDFLESEFLVKREVLWRETDAAIRDLFHQARLEKSNNTVMRRTKRIMDWFKQ